MYAESLSRWAFTVLPIDVANVEQSWWVRYISWKLDGKLFVVVCLLLFILPVSVFSTYLSVWCPGHARYTLSFVLSFPCLFVSLPPSPSLCSSLPLFLPPLLPPPSLPPPLSLSSYLSCLSSLHVFSFCYHCLFVCRSISHLFASRFFCFLLVSLFINICWFSYVVRYPVMWLTTYDVQGAARNKRNNIKCILTCLGLTKKRITP